MRDKLKKAIIIISYPRRPGFILKAHNLKQQLTAHFGLSAKLEEQTDDCFTVVLNDRIIYSNPMKNETPPDHKKIISAVSKYIKPLEYISKAAPEPDDSNDSDHQSWMNSVCSGE